MAVVIPLIATFFGALVSALLGVLISGQNEIKRQLLKLNGTLFDHITQKGIHESAVVKLDERIHSLLERVERVEEHT